MWFLNTNADPGHKLVLIKQKVHGAVNLGEDVGWTPPEENDKFLLQ